MSDNESLSYVDELNDLPEALICDEDNSNCRDDLKTGDWCCETSGWPGAFKIPTCPFCDAVAWDSRACSHLVFLYDTDSDKYFRLSNVIIKLCNVDSSDLPSAEYWVDSIAEIEVFETAHCMHSTLIWGFLNS